jgi:hypothetical protein
MLDDVIGTISRRLSERLAIAEGRLGFPLIVPQPWSVTASPASPDKLLKFSATYVGLFSDLSKNPFLQPAKATDLKFATPRCWAGSEFQVQSCFRTIESKASLDLKCDFQPDPNRGRV